jgi:hypothetical protein
MVDLSRSLAGDQPRFTQQKGQNRINTCGDVSPDIHAHLQLAAAGS